MARGVVYVPRAGMNDNADQDPRWEKLSAKWSCLPQTTILKKEAFA